MSEKKVKKLLPNELSSFCAQMAMLLKSGTPIAEGIAILYEDNKDEASGVILGRVRDHVEMGEPLFLSLTEADCFPLYMINMVRIGEQSGKLDEVLDSLCAYYDWEESVSQSIRSAVTYPLIMIGMMMLVVVVLVVKVLPVFGDVFRQLGGELSGASQGVMQMGTVLGRYSIGLICLLVVLVLGYLVMRRTKKGARLLAIFQAKFFVTKKLSGAIASGRFASAMALMLSSGLQTDESLALVGDLVDHPILHDKITACQTVVTQGISFSDALVQTGIFTGVYARMVTVAFRTGSVDTVMKKLADSYEREIDNHIDNLISILEPTLVAVLSVIVGMILLSVMLPLLGIMSTIG